MTNIFKLNLSAFNQFQEEEKLMPEINIDIRYITAHMKMHNSFSDEISTIYSTISIDNIEQANFFLKLLTH